MPYQVIACRFRVERSLLNVAPSGGDDTLDALLSSIFEQMRNEIKTSADHGVIDYAQTAPRHPDWIDRGARDDGGRTCDSPK